MKRYFICLILIISCLQVFARSADSTFNLDGYWDIYLNKSPEQVFAGEEKDGQMIVPGYWNKFLLEKTGSSDPKIYACYKTTFSGLIPEKKYAFLSKDQPSTSCAVYINQKLITVNGDPFYMINHRGEKDGHSHSKIIPVFGEFYPDSNGNAEIVFLISNYFYRKSGIKDSVIIGPAEVIKRHNTLQMTFYTMVAGIFLCICLLTLFQFFINKRKFEYLYLSLISIVCALRVTTSGYCALGVLFSALSGELKCKLEYLIMWVLSASIVQMLCTLYPARKNYKFEIVLRTILISFCVLFGVLSLILPAAYSNQLVPYLQYCIGASCVYGLLWVGINMYRKSKHIKFYLVSCIILVAGTGLDILYTKFPNILPFSFFPFFLAGFVIIQIFHLATIQNDILTQTVKATSDLKTLNDAYLRFVPKEFLKLLNEDSIINVKAGDFSRIEMPIIFSKINIESAENGRQITPEEHFKIFNLCLTAISPVIKNHNGFVTKFLSGGFMALFTKETYDSLTAGIEILKTVKKINDENPEFIITPRIGIHYGKMIIGTIGEENRLDDTVISDTVNTSSRIESVCEQLNKNLIISQSLFNKVSDIQYENIKFTELDAISVKGKNQPLTLYEVN